MKLTLFFILLIISGLQLHSQAILGTKDINDWELNTENSNSSLLKIDNDRFIAFYRNDAESAFLVLDYELAVIKKIQIYKWAEKTNKWKAFGLSYVNRPFPIFYYEKETNQIVSIELQHLENTISAVVAKRYSIDNETLIETDTIKKTSKGNIDVTISPNNEYILIRNHYKVVTDDDDYLKVVYEVHHLKIGVIYETEESFGLKENEYSSITNDGELLHIHTETVKKKVSYIIKKFDSKGNNVGSITYKTPEDDIKYDFYNFKYYNNDKSYLVFSKLDGKDLVGIMALFPDFDKSLLIKVVDKSFDKDFIANVNAKASINNVYANADEYKEFDTKNFSISDVYIDNTGFYFVTEYLMIQSMRSSSGYTTYTTNANNMLIFGFSPEGQLKWTTPISRQEKYTYGNSFLGVLCKIDHNSENMNIMIPSHRTMYVGKINKATGAITKPIKLTNSVHADFFSNCNYMIWLNDDNPIIFVHSNLQRYRALYSYKIKY